MIDKDAYSVVCELLYPESFYEPRNQKIYEAIRELELREKPVDVWTVTEQLAHQGDLEDVGGPGYVTELSSRVSSSASIEYHARIIAQKFLARQLISYASVIETKAFDETIDVEDLMQEAEGSLFELSQKNMKKDYTQIDPVIKNAVDGIQKAAANKDGLTGVSTGYYKLDDMTSGWQASDLIIIAGRPAMGKTSFALSMAKNIASDNKVPMAFFSLEMPAKSIAMRLFAIDSKVELAKIIKAQFIGDEFERIMDSCSRLYDLRDNMYIVDVPNISLTELRTKARVLANEKHIDCIVIDYIGLISVPTSYGVQKTFERVSMVSLALKQLARELKVPVVVLCQVGRESEEQAPILSNLRDSGSIEQDADIVCFLHRKKQLTEEEKQKNLVDNQGRASIQVTKFIIAKNRNGETGAFKIGYNGPLTYYADVAQDAEFIDYDPKPISKK